MSGTLGQAQTILKRLVTAWRKPSDEGVSGDLRGELRARLFAPVHPVPPKIAVVNYEGQIRRVNLLHYIGKLFFRPAVVRHVTNQREFKSGALNSPFRWNSGATKEKKRNARDNQNRLQLHLPTHLPRASFAVSHICLLFGNAMRCLA